MFFLYNNYNLLQITLQVCQTLPNACSHLNEMPIGGQEQLNCFIFLGSQKLLEYQAELFLPVMVFTSISWSIVSVTAVYEGKFLLAKTPHKFPNNFPFTNFLFTYLTYYNATPLLFVQTMTSLSLTPESRSAANAAGHVIFY